FTNEPDTDFTLAGNREWIEAHLATDAPDPAPPLLTHTDEIDAVIRRAQRWDVASDERRRVLTRAAEVMAGRRGRTGAIMAAETAKIVREGDPEVSEGIDMARWAATQTRELDALAADGATHEPVGTVLVAAPWNFPYAIPANGVCSALAAGNAVLLKPAPE